MSQISRFTHPFDRPGVLLSRRSGDLGTSLAAEVRCLSCIHVLAVARPDHLRILPVAASNQTCNFLSGSAYPCKNRAAVGHPVIPG
jgi:hypothetical protein